MCVRDFDYFLLLFFLPPDQTGLIRLSSVAMLGFCPLPTGLPPGTSRLGNIGSTPSGLGSATAAMGNLNLAGAKPHARYQACRFRQNGTKPARITLRRPQAVLPQYPASEGQAAVPGVLALAPGRALSIGSPTRQPQQTGTPFANFSFHHVGCLVPPAVALNIDLSFGQPT